MPDQPGPLEPPSDSEPDEADTIQPFLGERSHDLVDRIESAAVQAEMETGVREATAEQAKAHIAVRIARITLGFLVVIIGFALLPLPGPGWVVIAGGFVILSKDFAWADRTVRLIRRRVPGVPEDGRIPTIMIHELVGDVWARIVDFF